MNGPKVFFQIAAGLIPTLAFGAVISDKIKPNREYLDKHKVRATGFGVLAVAAAILTVFAEVNAITASFNGPTSETAVWSVSAVLVGATVITLCVIAWPWLPDWSHPIAYYVAWFGFILGVIVLVRSVDYSRPDGASVSAELQLLSQDVSARQAAGLISAEQARQFQECIADKAVGYSIVSDFDNGILLTDNAGGRIFPHQHGTMLLRLPAPLARTVVAAVDNGRYCDTGQ